MKRVVCKYSGRVHYCTNEPIYITSVDTRISMCLECLKYWIESCRERQVPNTEIANALRMDNYSILTKEGEIYFDKIKLELLVS